ncbi:hypothetical protein HID58_025978 [Brassica napus]|uniref:Protein kinase domain-containing protein n=1 Tax=Brassica napus TaxID=3708 RepID=A0ABQ8CMN6_BRANA|nr:hypothetical protein HID58_025978 [Brassica napus]
MEKKTAKNTGAEELQTQSPRSSPPSLHHSPTDSLHHSLLRLLFTTLFSGFSSPFSCRQCQLREIELSHVSPPSLLISLPPCHLYIVLAFLAGRTNIYILLEYNTCGELFIELFVMNILVKQKLGSTYTSLPKELIPGKLLLDSQGNLKISDYGLSALPERVLSHKGYNGVVADVWSCGVILYVLSHNS